MAIIDCPNCRKKVSDKAKLCSHCQFDIQNTDPDKAVQLKKTSKIQKSQSLMNHSFIAMLLFCGGILTLFWRGEDRQSFEYIASVSATIIGFVLYIITRVRIFLLKVKK